jgi:hypothetical protein
MIGQSVLAFKHDTICRVAFGAVIEDSLDSLVGGVIGVGDSVILCT